MTRENYLKIFGFVLIVLLVYFIAYTLLYWQVPRRYPHIPGIGLALLGGWLGVVGAAKLKQTGKLGVWLGSGIGVLVTLYIMVKISTPAYEGVVVHCVAESQMEMDLKEQREALPPFVWPYQWVVAQEGSVIWYLLGEPGWQVTIRFPEDNNPFGLDQNRAPRNVFTGTVPGFISVGPVVNAGRGGYSIECTDESGQKIEADPGWGSPRKGG
jgi:hypothetical protein